MKKNFKITSLTAAALANTTDANAAAVKLVILKFFFILNSHVPYYKIDTVIKNNKQNHLDSYCAYNLRRNG